MEDKIQLIDEISFELDNIAIIDEYTESEEVTVTATTDEQIINPERGKMFGKVTVKAVTNEIDENITPTNIRAGVTILGIEGNLEPDKPDQTKVVNPTTEEQIITADTGYELASVTVQAVNPEDYHKKETTATINPTTSEQVVQPELNKVFNQVTVTAVNPADYYKPEETLNVSPTIEQQTIEAENGKVFNLVNVEAVDPKDYQKEEGAIHLAPSTEAQTITPQENHVFNEINIDPVTNRIDNNIKAENIKEGVSILGVEGNLKTEFEETFPEIFFNKKLETFSNNKVLGVGMYMFQAQYNLTSVYLKNCSQIGNNTFFGCSNLTNVDIPKCERIEAAAFNGCYNLTINAPALSNLAGSCLSNGYGGSLFFDFGNVATASSYGLNGTRFSIIEMPILSKISNNLMPNNSILTKFDAPLLSPDDGVGLSAFSNCYNLSYVSIYDFSAGSVFARCSKLEKIYLNGNSVRNCYLNAFENTPIRDSSYLGYYGSIYVPASLVDTYKNHATWSYLKDRIVAIPENEYLFMGMYSKETLSEMPIYENSKMYMHSYAFLQCYGISNFSNSVLKAIPYGAFYRCATLNEVSALNCKFVGQEAFSYCSNLKSVYLPNATIIKNVAFFSCHNLSNLEIPKAIHIGDGAFKYCYELSKVNLPDCAYLGNAAFQECYILAEINLPNCLKIGSSCFAYCKKFESIKLENEVVCNLVNSTAFLSTPILDSSYLGYYGSIYVPASLVSEYKKATNWAIYSDRITSII